MAAYGERVVLNMRVMRWRNGALSGSDLANGPGLGSSRTYEPGEMTLPTKPRPGLRRIHQEMNREAAPSGSQLRAAVSPKRARLEAEVQTNESMQDLNGTIEELEKTRTERSERLALTTAVERAIPSRKIPRVQSPIELLTPRDLSQTTETRLQVITDRVTIPDPSDTLGDPVVGQTVRKLIETLGRFVAIRNAPSSGVTAPYGGIDDTGRVEFSREMTKKTGIDSVTLPEKTSRAPERKIRKMPIKKCP